MTCDDLGAELWALVYHLFAKHRGAPQQAMRELALRTHCEWVEDHSSSAATVATPIRTPADVRRSSWFVQLSTAYAELRKDIREKHQHDEADARELVLSLYPDGCNVSDYADAVRTSAAMLPCTVPSDTLDRFITRKSEALTAEHVHVVGAEELVADVTRDLMLSALVPRQWWCRSSPSVARVTRVGVRGTPPTLFIEYERPQGVSHVRRIHLDARLREDMPTAQLARRLAVTHEALLSEEQFQGLLLRCQRCMRQSPTSAARGPATKGRSGSSSPMAAVAATPAAPPVEAAASAASSSSDAVAAKSAKPQKADLGLLYRDPDAALNNVDLNDADDVTLREFKEVMNERFNANVIKPGDPGYVYDKRLEVAAPAEKSEWDDDSD